LELAAICIACAALLGVGFYYGYHSARANGWPSHHDAWRDIGMAQTMLDGRYPEDNCLLGETLWFNPLVAFLVAGASHVTGLPPDTIDVQGGVYVNLLIPVAFVLLVAAFFGRRAALAALLFFLAGTCREQYSCSWTATVTYLPTLWAPALAQGFLYATLLAWGCSGKRHPWSWTVVAGLLWGLTFLTHTAPALLLGGIMLFTTILRVAQDRDKEHTRRVVLQFLLAAGIAFALSLPYTLPILARYRFHIVNANPLYSLIPKLELSHLPELLRENRTVSGGIALIGLLTLFRRKNRGEESWIIASWFGLTLCALAYLYLSQAVMLKWGIRLPQVVPAHHFLISLAGVKAVLFGVGLVALAEMPVAIVTGKASRWERPVLSRFRTRANAWASFAAVFLAGALLYPGYSGQSQFKKEYDGGWHTFDFNDRKNACYWIREHCQPSDVFLSDIQLAERIVAPAGRKVVATLDVFSSPYADYATRFDDYQELFRALAARDDQRFSALAKRRHVTHLLTQDWPLSDPHSPVLNTDGVESLARPYLARVYSQDGLTIYRVSL
jgi:hypothetical protein